MNSKLLSVLVLAAACAAAPRESQIALPYSELYRPQFHFSPPLNWTNDPNGLVFFRGEYHMFYQYNPYGDLWGHMSWGHAVSRDLLHWQNLPVAIPEYAGPNSDSTMVFSGTVVVDSTNSSGLCGTGACLVATYTSNVYSNGLDKAQHQSLASSVDNGRTWQRYSSNPVLDIGRTAFRDPKIFRTSDTSKWTMELVIPEQHKVQFYQSSNLINWSLSGEFGPAGDTMKIWECPDIYRLPIEGSDSSKWVLSLSGSHPSGPGFVGMQYFIGRFDGKTFVPDHKSPLYVDYGKDFYAGIAFNNLSRPVMVGWVSNWTYAKFTPTTPWRGAMSFPRQLSLRQTPSGVRLIQNPISGLAELRDKEFRRSDHIAGNVLELKVEIIPGTAKEAGVKILKSGNEETVVGYDVRRGELFIDRTHSGKIDFHKDFPSIDRAKLLPRMGKINLHILIDCSIVEVFANDGEVAMSELVFPTKTDYQVETYSKDGDASLRMQAWTIKSTWR